MLFFKPVGICVLCFRLFLVFCQNQKIKETKISASYPYIGDLASIPNILKRFRKTFAKNIAAKVIRTCEFAKKHENRLISILKFINVIDENANKTVKADKILKIYDDASVPFKAIKKFKDRSICEHLYSPDSARLVQTNDVSRR